jgi:hypothetical protein
MIDILLNTKQAPHQTPVLHFNNHTYKSQLKKYHNLRFLIKFEKESNQICETITKIS